MNSNSPKAEINTHQLENEQPTRESERDERNYSLMPREGYAFSSIEYDAEPDRRPGIGYRAKLEDLQVAGNI